MSRGVNKVILIGNLGGDPVGASTAAGSSVAKISLATSESWKDKNTGQQQERTEWHKIVFFNRAAEIIMLHAKKGTKLYVEGSLRTRKWQDKEGKDHYTTEIVGNEFQFLGGGHGDNADDSTSSTNASPPDNFDSGDDDIPF